MRACRADAQREQTVSQRVRWRAPIASRRAHARLYPATARCHLLQATRTIAGHIRTPLRVLGDTAIRIPNNMRATGLFLLIALWLCGVPGRTLADDVQRVGVYNNAPKVLASPSGAPEGILFDDAKDERYALDLGATQFIMKPKEPKVLMRILEEALASQE